MKEKLNCENCPWYSFSDQECKAPWDPGYDVACWVADEEVPSDD